MAEMNNVYNLLSDILGIAGRYSPDTLRGAIQHLETTSKGLTKEVLVNVLEQFERLGKDKGARKPDTEDKGARKPKTPDTEDKGARKTPDTEDKGARKTPDPEDKGARKPKTPDTEDKGARKPKTPGTEDKGARKPKVPAPEDKDARKPKVPAPAKPVESVESDDPEVWIKEIRAILGDTEFLPDKQDIIKLARKHFGDKITVRKGHRDSRADLISKTANVFRRAGKTRQRTIYRALRKAHLKKWGHSK